MPRAGWSTAFTIAPGPYNRLRGVAEAGGQLFALGRSGRTQPAIWVSEDSITWTAAEIPPMTERLPGADGSSADLAAIVVDIVDAGDRLVALASVGLADGSGLFGTMLYTSDDEGQTWSEVQSTRGTTAAAMFGLAHRGDQLIAVGTAVWSSHDGGLSWTEVVDAESLGGTMRSVAARDDLIVAVGDGGNGDLTGPPAIALVSTDGESWERIVIHPDAVARSVAIGPSGRIVVGGHRNADLLIWVSDDAGATWETTSPSAACCAADLVATPTGYVAAASASFEGALLSSDGSTWTQSALDSGLSAVDWGPRFGLTGATDDTILLGPVPAP